MMDEEDKDTFKLVGKIFVLQGCLLFVSYIFMSFVPNTSEFINAKEIYFELFYPFMYISITLGIIGIIIFVITLFKNESKNLEDR